ncbi:MAG TPA: S1C family serine protease [Polyangiaceae bacterium]|nr:S1C family serine protease [Polyangiaceae bacterium]
MAWRVFLVFVWVVLWLPGVARAQNTPPAKPAVPQAAIGFSKLLFRINNEERIGVAKEQFAIFILETLRERGFNAVGAENLVFDQDKSTSAEFLLGGTVRELDCLEQRRRVNCRIAIEWQLLDVRAGNVVYTALTRGLTLGADPNNAAGLGKTLVVAALDSLTRRPPFLNVLGSSITPAQAAKHAEAHFLRCATEDLALPDAAEKILPATAFVEAGDGFGSGFLLNADGLLLTAAHVVARGPLKVRLRDGSTHPASVIRTAPQVDAALLKIEGVVAPAFPCLALSTDVSSVGNEIYAIGAPARQDLAFSMTRGIVSGVREIEGQKFLQTDASVSPGNSGGPLVDRKGRAIGLVSWKLAGTAIQGVAFGVPIDAALRGLGLQPGDQTESALLAATAQPLASSPAAGKPYADGPDQIPSIDPEGDRLRAEQDRIQREKERQEKLAKLRDERTPAYVKIMRWGGLAVAIAGTLGVAITYSSYDPDVSTRSEYDSLTAWNTVSWVGAGVGLASFSVSYLLVPEVDEKEVSSRSKGRGGLHGVSVQGSF